MARSEADSSTQRGSAGEPAGGVPASRNEVVLVGRVAAAPEERVLPSGDRLVVWRLVVDRPPEPRRLAERPRSPRIDTLDCVAWTAATRRAAGGLAAGDVVQVVGALRRRFWRAGVAAVSRCEVEAASVKRLVRVPAARSEGSVSRRRGRAAPRPSGASE